MKVEWDNESKSWVDATGRPGAIYAEWDGTKWVEGRNPAGPGALRRGFATGMESTKGLVADVIPAMVQSAFGYDEAAKRNLEEYKARMDALRAKNLLAETDYTKVKDVGSALSFAGEAVGEAIPSMATALLGGVGVGAAAARVGAGRILSSQVAKRAAELEAKGLASEAALAAATKEASQKVGAAAGAFGGSALLNIPESYLNLAEAGNANLSAAFVVGSLKSALDALGPVRLLSKTRGPDFSDKLTDIISARLLKGRPGAAGAVGGFLETAALEGVTEGTQALLDETAKTILTDKSIDWNEVINSALKGGVGAAPIGAVAGGIGARSKAAARAEEETRRQQQEEERQKKEEVETYTAGRLTGEVPPPEKTASDYLYDSIAEVKTEFPGVKITGSLKDNKPSFDIDPKSLRIKAQQLVQQGTVNPDTNKPFTVPEAEKFLSSKIYSSLRSTYEGKSYEKLAGPAPTPTSTETQSAVAAATAFIDEVNQDPGSLENPFIAQEYNEAKRIVAEARDRETSLREKEEGAAQIPLEGYSPRFGTAVDTTPAETPSAPNVGEVEVESTGAPPLKAWQRRAIENIITELQPGGTLSVASIQNELSKEGTPVSLGEAKAILDQYVAEKNATQAGMQIVPPNLRLVKRDDAYVKPRTGTAEEAYRGEAPDLGTERGGARAFPDYPQPLVTEISSPVVPVQGTLQTPPAGLSQEDWAKLHNTLIRRTKTIDRDAVEVAAERELTNKQVKEILDALVYTNAIKRTGMFYRANPDAVPISAFQEEVVGGPTTQQPKEIPGVGPIPSREPPPRKKLQLPKPSFPFPERPISETTFEPLPVKPAPPQSRAPIAPQSPAPVAPTPPQPAPAPPEPERKAPAPKPEVAPTPVAEEEPEVSIDEDALRAQAESEIDAGPIGQAIEKIENGEIETKAQVRTLALKLEKNGVLEDIGDVREGLSDREQSADDVLDTLRMLLDEAREAAIEERFEELVSEAETEPPKTRTPRALQVSEGQFLVSEEGGAAVVPEGAPPKVAKMVQGVVNRSNRLLDAMKKSIPDDYSCG